MRNLIPDENLLLSPRPSNFNVICFEVLESTKISSCEPVSSQKCETGYRTRIYILTVCFLPSCDMYKDNAVGNVVAETSRGLISLYDHGTTERSFNAVERRGSTLT